MGELSCLNDRKNIGASSCKKKPAQIRGFISTPNNFSIPLSDAGDESNWQNALLAARSSRIYLWPFAFTAENINEGTVYEETSLGTINVRDGRYKWRMNFVENLKIHKNMFSHKEFQGRVFLIDDQNQIIGTSSDGVNFQGFTIDLLNPEKMFFNDGSAGTKSPVYISLQDNLEFDKSGYLVGAAFLNNLIRLTTVNVSVETAPAPAATGFVASVKSELDCEPILGLIQADFVVLDALGAAQTITGVTDNEDGTYTFVGTALVTGTVNLISASALSLAGFESAGPVILTV